MGTGAGSRGSPVVVKIDVEKMLQAVLHTVEDEVGVEVPPSRGAVALHGEGVLHYAPNPAESQEEELKVFQFRCKKNPAPVGQD